MFVSQFIGVDIGCDSDANGICVKRLRDHTCHERFLDASSGGVEVYIRCNKYIILGGTSELHSIQLQFAKGIYNTDLECLNNGTELGLYLIDLPDLQVKGTAIPKKPSLHWGLA